MNSTLPDLSEEHVAHYASYALPLPKNFKSQEIVSEGKYIAVIST